jgi:N-acetylmuramoyl-L-alanine amidase
MNKKYSGQRILLIIIAISFFIYKPLNIFSQLPDNSYKLKTVVIDAGHGGKDPGSLGKQTTEKAIALAIALKAGNYIEHDFPEVKVIYTRKTDVFIPLHQRAEIANSGKADLFISVHVNGSDNKQIDGTESLVLGTHRAGENFEVAKKENSVILLEDDYKERYEGFDPDLPESYQSFSLMQDLYFKKSIEFAGLVQEQFREKAQRKDRSVRQQGLLVLAQTAMPGILVETGFITNADEEQYLMTEQGQDYIASAIFRAFRDYKNLVESNTSYAIASAENKQPAGRDSALTDHVSNSEDNSSAVAKENVQTKLTTILFKVQITASSKSLAPDSHLFKGLKDVKEYHVGNLFKYAVGNNKTFQEAIVLSRSIKEKFPDAFIIAVKDNTIIPLDQALKETQIPNTNN